MQQNTTTSMQSAPCDKSLPELVSELIPYAVFSVKKSRKNAKLAKTSWWREFHEIFAQEAEELLKKLVMLETKIKQTGLVQDEYTQVCKLLQEALPAVRRKIKKTKSGQPSPESKAFKLWLETEHMVQKYLKEGS